MPPFFFLKRSIRIPKLCLVSHEHSDHSKYVRDFIVRGTECAMTEGTRNALGLSRFKIKILKAKEPFSFGTWIILPFDTVHDAEEPVGFLLASQHRKMKILYATDTAFLRYRFKGLTHMLIECNYKKEKLRQNPDLPSETQNRILLSHMEISTLEEMLKCNDLSKLKELYLIHISPTNGDKEEFVRRISKLTTAKLFANWQDPELS